MKSFKIKFKIGGGWFFRFEGGDLIVILRELSSWFKYLFYKDYFLFLFKVAVKIII